MQIITCQQKCLVMRCICVGVFTVLLLPGMVAAQVSVSAGGHEVNIESGNDASNDSGGISGDVQIEGVAIINGKVYIDGVRVIKGTREVISKKTGRIYRIDWGKDGNVTVTEK